MKRLSLIKSQLTSNKRLKVPKMVKCQDYLRFDDLLTKEEIDYRSRFIDYLTKNVRPFVEELAQKEAFNKEMYQKLARAFPEIPKQTLSDNLNFALALEISKVDLSFGTTFLHQIELGLNTFLSYASEKQIRELKDKLINYEIFISFNLTEPNHGSDASSLDTTAKVVNGKFIINGVKKWAANVTQADVFIIWAMYEKKIRGFLVDKNTKGLTVKRINGKLSLRGVQNGEVHLDNCEISLDCILPNANSFNELAGKMLLKTRLGTGIAATGACIEAYDLTATYVSQRVQFGQPLCSFQLVQEKLVNSMANIQTMLYYSFDSYTKLMSKNSKLTMGEASTCKVYCTSTARETIRFLRDIWGANGVLSSNKVIRILMDLEALHTYEGTREINTLIAGREILGLSAFK